MYIVKKCDFSKIVYLKSVVYILNLVYITNLVVYKNVNTTLSTLYFDYEFTT